METGSSSETDEIENDNHHWNYAPDSILLHLFGYLSVKDLVNVGHVCQLWWRISRDDIIWKHRFMRDYCVNPRIPILPGALGWQEEYKRLYCDVPIVESECLDAHSHQVLHVSFSHNGHMFATTSKDGNILVWNSTYPSTLKYHHSMKEFSWKYTQYSQFNCSDTLLLVSGVHFGSSLSTSGEIAVFTLQNEFLLQCRVVNKPYDVFGCWIGEHHLISGELHWLGHLTSSSILWVNKASQEPESEHTPIITPLYRIYNANASSVRSVLISECKWFGEQCDQENNESEQDILNLELQSKASPNQTHPPTIFYNPEYRIRQNLAESEEVSSDSESGSFSGSSQDDGLKNKLLIFATGANTYTPHQIGFKRIDKIEFPQRLSPGPSIKERLAAREREREREIESLDPPNWADFNSVKHKFNMPDKVIDLHGHIIGMALSPDHKYLYVNSRSWPSGYQIQNPLEPPIVESHISIHVIDLTNLTPIGCMLEHQKTYTPSADCFYVFLDVSDKYVASGDKTRSAFIWDRYYGICLTLLPHSDCVNAIAFNPTNPHMCVTASDDYSIRVWRSTSSCKQLRIHGRGQIKGSSFRKNCDDL